MFQFGVFYTSKKQSTMSFIPLYQSRPIKIKAVKKQPISALRDLDFFQKFYDVSITTCCLLEAEGRGSPSTSCTYMVYVLLKERKKKSQVQILWKKTILLLLVGSSRSTTTCFLYKKFLSGLLLHYQINQIFCNISPR